MKELTVVLLDLLSKHYKSCSPVWVHKGCYPGCCCNVHRHVGWTQPLNIHKPLSFDMVMLWYVLYTITQIFSQKIFNQNATFESFPKRIWTANEKDAITSSSLARKEVLHTTWWRMVIKPVPSVKTQNVSFCCLGGGGGGRPVQAI